MKTMAALIAGLFLSCVTFVGGAVIALVFMAGGATDVRPQHAVDTASLWTSSPVIVARERQSLTRLPVRPEPEAKTVALDQGRVVDTRKNVTMADVNQASENARPGIDPVITDAIDTSQKLAPGVAQAHEEWCSRRYASYRAADDTYQPYSGGRRTCVSPEQNMTAIENSAGGDIAAEDDQAEVQEASYAAYSASDDSEHVKSCLARYRSYNIADNSYQPFDGGLRRQCE